MPDLSLLTARAYRIRRYALRMGEVQGQGYIGQALGWADVLAVAYGHAMNLKPDDPQWEGRDRFLLSHGHYAIAHYAALIEAGIVPEAELDSYGSDDSRYGPGVRRVAAMATAAGMRTTTFVSDGTAHDWHTVHTVFDRALPVIAARFGLA